MIQTSCDVERQLICNLFQQTGKDLNTWMETIKIEKLHHKIHILSWLKNRHGFSHLAANLLVGIYLNNGKAVYG
ncbi:MAG: DUF4287 domain-containing protein [Saprospiraceae bacterium]|nr:DUF4287 domain-containing protein [Saprospiraceae bacterium]